MLEFNFERRGTVLISYYLWNEPCTTECIRKRVCKMVQHPFFFKDFIYLFEREKENMSGMGAGQKEKEKTPH